MSTTPAPPGVPPDQTAPADQTQDQRLAHESEARLTGNRDVHFETRRVQPPAALYVTADDGLYVVLANLQPSLILTVTATILLPDGRVQANTWNMAPPATGAQTPYLWPLTEGYVINVSVSPSGALRYGMTWVFITIRRGGMVSGVNLQTLIADYVDSYGGPTWPGDTIKHSVEEPGLILTQYTASVPAGQSFILTVPSYARVLVRAIFAVFSTSATVASRSVQLYLTDPSGNLCYSDVSAATQAASINNNYSWGLKLGYTQETFNGGNMVRSLPELILMPGSQLNLTAINQQATDQFKFAAMNYEQWFSF